MMPRGEHHAMHHKEEGEENHTAMNLDSIHVVEVPEDVFHLHNSFQPPNTAASISDQGISAMQDGSIDVIMQHPENENMFRPLENNRWRTAAHLTNSDWSTDDQSSQGSNTFIAKAIDGDDNGNYHKKEDSTERKTHFRSVKPPDPRNRLLMRQSGTPEVHSKTRRGKSERSVVSSTNLPPLKYDDDRMMSQSSKRSWSSVKFEPRFDTKGIIEKNKNQRSSTVSYPFASAYRSGTSDNNELKFSSRRGENLPRKTYIKLDGKKIHKSPAIRLLKEPIDFTSSFSDIESHNDANSNQVTSVYDRHSVKGDLKPSGFPRVNQGYVKNYNFQKAENRSPASHTSTCDHRSYLGPAESSDGPGVSACLKVLDSGKDL